jgi:hypothetical protein
MNTSPVPDELIMFDRQFSWRTTFRVGRGWFLALVLSVVCDWIFPDLKRHWPSEWRAALVAVEFLAIVLFIFDAIKWIRNMDELQRRITLAALMFSVSASFFFFVLWLRLEREGFVTWDDSSVGDCCVLLGGFYGLGFLIFKRRYNEK